MKPTKDVLDYQPYLIHKVDSKRTRLIKVKEFLLRLNKINPRKFDYCVFLGMFDYDYSLPVPTDTVLEVLNNQVRQVFKDLLATPTSLNNATDLAIYDTSPTECGTCACIAGWTYILNRIPASEQAYRAVDMIASEVLQLDPVECRFLFYGYGYPGTKFKDLGISSGSAPEEPPSIEDAIERLDFLISKEPSL